MEGDVCSAYGILCRRGRTPPAPTALSLTRCGTKARTSWRLFHARKRPTRFSPATDHFVLLPNLSQIQCSCHLLLHSTCLTPAFPIPIFASLAHSSRHSLPPPAFPVTCDAPSLTPLKEKQDKMLWQGDRSGDGIEFPVCLTRSSATATRCRLVPRRLHQKQAIGS